MIVYNNNPSEKEMKEWNDAYTKQKNQPVPVPVKQSHK